jgi:hypothetical protein
MCLLILSAPKLVVFWNAFYFYYSCCHTYVYLFIWLSCFTLIFGRTCQINTCLVWAKFIWHNHKSTQCLDVFTFRLNMQYFLYIICNYTYDVLLSLRQIDPEVHFSLSLNWELNKILLLSSFVILFPTNILISKTHNICAWLLYTISAQEIL